MSVFAFVSEEIMNNISHKFSSLEWYKGAYNGFVLLVKCFAKSYLSILLSFEIYCIRKNGEGLFVDAAS